MTQRTLLQNAIYIAEKRPRRAILCIPRAEVRCGPDDRPRRVKSLFEYREMLVRPKTRTSAGREIQPRGSASAVPYQIAGAV